RMKRAVTSGPQSPVFGKTLGFMGCDVNHELSRGIVWRVSDIAVYRQLRVGPGRLYTFVQMDWRTCWTIVIVGGLTCVSCGREIPSAKKEQNSPSRSIAVSGNSDAAAPRTATQFHDFQVPPVFLKVLQEAKQHTQLPILLPSELPE